MEIGVMEMRLKAHRAIFSKGGQAYIPQRYLSFTSLPHVFLRAHLG
jgi:hypothetical protein